MWSGCSFFDISLCALVEVSGYIFVVCCIFVLFSGFGLFLVMTFGAVFGCGRFLVLTFGVGHLCVLTFGVGPTQGLSKLANTILSTYLDTVPALVKNSTQVINMLEQLSLPPTKHKNLTLATMDVTSLYPSIPQMLGINMALQQAIPTNPPNSKENNRKNMLREMLSLILKENTFTFTDKHYRQLKGVAMGTLVAPTLTNLFMAKVETEALRFIDDILIIMESTPLQLHSFVSHCNSGMGPIKYTVEVSGSSIDFLDVTIFKGQRHNRMRILDIRPFSKAIDTTRTCITPRLTT